jgi:hypothetical protein
VERWRARIISPVETGVAPGMTLSMTAASTMKTLAQRAPTTADSRLLSITACKHPKRPAGSASTRGWARKRSNNARMQDETTGG